MLVFFPISDFFLIWLGFQVAGELVVNDPFGPGVQFKLKGLLPDQKSLKVGLGV